MTHDLIDAHLEETAVRKSDHTHKNRATTLRQWTAYCENRGLDVLTARTAPINDWINALLNDDYTDKTVLNKVYDLSAFLQYCMERGHIEQNPIQEMDVTWLSSTPELDQHSDVRYLTVDEYEQVLAAIDKPRNDVLIRLLWETGVRAGEASAIEIGDLDRSAREVEVETGKQTRSNTQTRTVYYRPSFGRALQEWLDNGHRDSYLRADASDRLLLSRDSDHLPPTRISEIVDEVATAARLQETLWTNQRGQEMNRITPHTFRHSYAVHRTKNGMPIVYLSELMGHAEIDVTRKYLQFRDDDIREAEQQYAPR